MDKVIVTALLMMAAVVASVLVINSVLPALGRSGSSVLSSSRTASDIIKTDIKIIAVEANGSTVYVWIKNVGSGNVTAINRGDTFLEEVGASFTRMSYVDPGATDACANAPAAVDSWWYCIEDAETTWKPNFTVKITMTLSAPASGDYKVKYITNNGVDDEKSFSA